MWGGVGWGPTPTAKKTPQTPHEVPTPGLDKEGLFERTLELIPILAGYDVIFLQEVTDEVEEIIKSEPAFHLRLFPIYFGQKRAKRSFAPI